MHACCVLRVGCRHTVVLCRATVYVRALVVARKGVSRQRGLCTVLRWLAQQRGLGLGFLVWGYLRFRGLDLRLLPWQFQSRLCGWTWLCQVREVDELGVVLRVEHLAFRDHVVFQVEVRDRHRGGRQAGQEQLERFVVDARVPQPAHAGGETAIWKARGGAARWGWGGGQRTATGRAASGRFRQHAAAGCFPPPTTTATHHHHHHASRTQCQQKPTQRGMPVHFR